MTDEINLTEAEAIAELGRASMMPVQVKDGGSYAVIPDGHKLHDLDDYLPRPRRARGTVSVHERASFSRYVKRFTTPATAIFADQISSRITGVIDYHSPEAADHAEHRIVYPLPKSKEWTTWLGHSGKIMSQLDFAAFIESNQIDITKPAGAEMLEVAKNLQARRAVEFASAIRLDNGSQEFTYNDTTNANVGKGKLKVPNEFKLGIPVYLGGEAWELLALLRYRIGEGRLSLWYDLKRPELVERAAFRQVVDLIHKETGIEPYLGAV